MLKYIWETNNDILTKEINQILKTEKKNGIRQIKNYKESKVM